MAESKPEQTENNKKEKQISFYEKHKKIYIKEVSGWWNHWRWFFVIFTQIIFYGLPWLTWNDRQAVLFHLVERKFYIFGLVLWPQDVFYLAILLIISAYALFLFTAVAGRLFCGYACPQTVYTEIYMWIENRIEGADRLKRKKLDEAPMSAEKFRKKFIKHFLWIALALWTGFTLTAYFTPMSELFAEFPYDLSAWEIFWILFYAAFLYMQAGFLREQVCKYMCPYARFQGVMYDPDTLVITYDKVRGEPRGLKKKSAKAEADNAVKLGDCVDCNLCVVTCPTGIDIRNGLQYECIGCGACIDACDPVMDKLKKPRGLIRYTSENALAKGKEHEGLFKHLWRPRIMIYSGILALIIAAAGWSLVARVPLKVDVIRDRAVLARENIQGRIENVYELKIMNVTEQPQKYTISVEGLPGIAMKSEVDLPIEVAPAANHEVSVTVDVEPDAAPEGANNIYFVIKSVDDENLQVREKASFLMQKD